jgi:UDP-N-acetylmuramyl pentapeptide phosphotransferase/UDP-N-acetylglucosamine-1-phosphate transferase
MGATRIAGLILLVFGLVALLWGGIFWKNRDTVVDAGPLKIQTEKHHGIAIPPVVGGIAIVAGVVLLVLPRRTAS